MSTVIPQRTVKRQRLVDEKAAREASLMQAQGQLGPSTETLVIQFQSGQDGSLLGPAINLPAATGQKELQAIINQLRRQIKQAQGPKKRTEDDPESSDDDDDDDLPYAFHVDLQQHILNNTQAQVKEEVIKSNARLPINDSLSKDVLNAQAAKKLGLSQEDTLTVVFEPQAVFKVRTVNRCSSTMSGHASPILCSTFSPTGSLLATGAGDKTARLWDLDTETPMHTLVGHSNWVLCAEWEGRERKLATGGMDGEVWIWEALDPKFTGRKGWLTRTGKQVDEEWQAEQDSLAGPEGETEEEKTKRMGVRQRRAARNAAPQGKALKGHSKWVTSLSWEPIHVNNVNPRLASSSKDATVRVWNTTLQRCEYVLGGHTASVNCVKWGGEGAIYTASSDRTVKVWSADGGKLIRSLNEHAHWVNTIAISTDFVLRTGPFDHTGRASSAAGTPSYVQPTDEEAKQSALKRWKEATGAGATPETIITGSDDLTLFLWPPQINGNAPQPKKSVARLTGHQKTVNHVAFSPDGKKIASASFDNSVKLWEGATGKFIATLRGHVASVYRLAWSSDSRLLVSASKDSTLKLWDPIKTFKIRKDLPGHEDEVYCVDFVADKVASGGRDKVVKIWRH